VDLWIVNLNFKPLLNHYWKPFIFQKLLCSAASRLLQESFYLGTTLPCSILFFPGIHSIQELLCSAASRLIQESFYPGTTLLCSIPSFPGLFLSRNYFALQHTVFSRNLLYPGTALLCSILSFPGIFLSSNCSAMQHPVFSRNPSIQELLCSAASRLFQESFYPVTALLSSMPSFPGIFLSRNCSILSFPGIFLSRNYFALQHPFFSRNLFYPGTALLCSILSFQESSYPVTALLCRIPSFPGIFLSRNYSALQHLVFSRNLSIQ